MKQSGLLMLALLIAGCTRNAYEANIVCARTAGCVSSFDDQHRGPIQQQAVAPINPGALTPNR